ncbi:MAG: hypothetical protein ACQEQU_06960, partial [Spirochaetota bacterium]
QTPQDNVRVLEGIPQVCRVSARAVSPQVDIASLTDDINWYVDGDEMGSGLSYQFIASDPGSYEVQAVYRKELGRGELVRETDPITIVVEEFSLPVINTPAADRVIYYERGDTLKFSGSGYEQASYTWFLDDTIVGRGRDVNYTPPNGLSGSFNLRLVTEYKGVSRRAEQSLNLKANTPPSVTLRANSVQYTGSALQYEAHALDIEDGALPTELYLDGVRIDTDAEIQLGTEELGQHQLRAKATDSQGVTREQQASFSVQEGVTGLTIVTPKAQDSLIEGKPFELFAMLQGGNAATKASGEFSWLVEYLEAPGAPKEELTGNGIEFIPEHTGAVKIAAAFQSEETGIAVSGSRAATIAPEPLEVSLYWPHGEMVNAGSDLKPELVGGASDQEIANTDIQWFIDGKPRDYDTLTAPRAGGEHTIAVRVSENETVTARDQLSFLVNEAPSVTITSPLAASRYRVGTPIISTAEVGDDQPADVTVDWEIVEGTSLGSGTSVVLESLPEGNHTLRATAEDQYGAVSSDEVELRVYPPLNISQVQVNNQIGTYLLDSGEGIPVAAEITGGVDPSASWRLLQGETEAVLNASETGTLSTEQGGFTAGPAVVRLSVEDRGSVQYVQDYPMQLVGEAYITVTAPETGTPLWAKEAQTFLLDTAGLEGARFSATLQGETVEVQQLGSKVSGSQAEYSLSVDTSGITREGVYELIFTADSNGLNREASYMMNVYTHEPGLALSSTPETIDLRSSESSVVTAEPFGISPETIHWFTANSDQAAASGTTADLTQLDLPVGTQQITVEARDASEELLDSLSFNVRVLGEMDLRISPDDEQLVILQGAETTLTATAFDRDGRMLEGEEITWTSHLSGPLGTGTQLQPGTTDASVGEHLITVEAEGSGGESIKRIAKVTIRSAAESPPEDTKPPEGQQPAQRRTLTDGQEIDLDGGNAGWGDRVSTVLSVSGNVKVLRDRTESVTVETSFTAEDTIDLRGRAPSLLLRTAAGEMLTLNERGRYTWDSASSTWTKAN